MTVDKKGYVDTSNVCNSYSKETYDAFTPYHFGCDTKSYSYKNGKVNHFNRMVAWKFTLMNSVGVLPLTSENLQNMLIFNRQLCNQEKKVRIMYKQESEGMTNRRQNQTCVYSLLSSQEHLKTQNLQAYIWKECLMQNNGLSYTRGQWLAAHRWRPCAIVVILFSVSTKHVQKTSKENSRCMFRGSWWQRKKEAVRTSKKEP